VRAYQKLLDEDAQADRFPTVQELLALDEQSRIAVAEQHAEEVIHTDYSRKICFGTIVVEVFKNGQVCTRYNDEYTLHPDEWAYLDGCDAVSKKGLDLETKDPEEDKIELSKEGMKLFKAFSNKGDWKQKIVIENEFGDRSVVPDELSNVSVSTGKIKTTIPDDPQWKKDKDAKQAAILKWCTKKHLEGVALQKK